MCGIFGVFNARKAAELTVIGLHHLQHRANDYAGVVSTDGEYLYRHSDAGLVTEVFDDKLVLDGLHGLAALGHIRYPTVEDDVKRDNTQPIKGTYNRSEIAIAHNGNLTNLSDLKKRLRRAKFATSMDTESILRLVQSVGSGAIEDDLPIVFRQLRGSYALGILLPDCLIGACGPEGNRPLSVGKLEGGGYCISSETCAFPNVGAAHLFDVKPGTMVIITEGGCHEIRFAKANEKKCVFEGIYFSHPASDTFGVQVAEYRMKLGRQLEELFPVENADIVVQVPDSANFIALGYAESGRSGKYFPVLFRHHDVGRTFIAATQASRDVKVSQKFTFAPSLIRGKIIVIVDYSIVRGTTLRNMVRMFFDLGAREVHVRIGSPPIKHPCTYGINTPTTKDLKSAHLGPDEICAEIGATSLKFLPLEALRSLSPDPESHCFACMDGKYW